MKRIIATMTIFLIMFSITSQAFDSNYIGVCSHPNRYDDPTVHLDAIIDSGVKWIRLGASWATVEPSKGVYSQKVLTKWDYIIKKLSDNGVNILFGLGSTPIWASSQPDNAKPEFCMPSDISGWENYINFMTTRYKNYVTAWEIWNEPDYNFFWRSSVEDFYELLRSAYPIIKRANPANKVLIGGLTFYDGLVAEGSWFDSLMALGGYNYFDIVNYHAYIDSVRIDKKYKCLIEVMNKYGPPLSNMKIWVTETGYSSSGVAEEESSKSEFIDQIYALHKRYDNVERIFYYSFCNTNINNVKEDNFGLNTFESVPLEAFYHFQALNGAENDFPQSQKTERLTLTYDDQGVNGSTVTVDNHQLKLSNQAELGMMVNDNWLYDSNGGLDDQVYIDIAHPSGCQGATWQIIYDGQDSAGAVSEIKTITNNNSDVATVLLQKVKFANRLGNLADFKIKVVSGTLLLNKITVRKISGRGVCFLGEKDRSTMLEHIIDTVPENIAYNPATVKGGKECRSISDNRKAFYFSTAKGLAKEGDSNISVSIEYFDAGTDYLNFEYNNPNKAVSIKKTNTNTWKTAQINITDANFNNMKSYNADFRITNGGDNSSEYISKVVVTCHPPYTVTGDIENYGGTCNTIVNFKNQYSQTPKHATAFLALYDNQKLVSVEKKFYTILPQVSGMTDFFETKLLTNENQMLKLFLWEDMQPIGDAKFTSGI